MNLWAVDLVRVWRRLAAWALPCPSAIASAKLANRTVNQSQIPTPRIKLVGSSEGPVSALNQRTVVKMLPR